MRFDHPLTWPGTADERTTALEVVIIIVAILSLWAASRGTWRR